MGRHAKHLTNAERASAQKKNDLRYSETPRAKVVRAATQRARYLSETTRKDRLRGPKSIPGLTPLPAFVQTLYAEPLPTGEHLFRQALSSSDALDESDLNRWRKEPPFEEDDDERDPCSPEYQHFTTSLVAVLHGVKLREQNERDHLRRDEFKTKGWDHCMETLRAEVEKRLKEWEHLTNLNIYHPYHHAREWAMHRHQIQWQARTIYHLYYLKFLT